MLQVTVRKLNINDWKSVSEIYRQGIETGHATFEKNVPSWVEWDRKHLPICRLVAVADKEVVGWVALTPFSLRDVYKGVAEVSLYVSVIHSRKGVGKQLLRALIEESEKKGIWTLQASFFPKNIPSIKLHMSCGFKRIGVREKIGCMDGKWRDTVLFERRSKVAGI